jgi:hypothetical protein
VGGGGVGRAQLKKQKIKINISSKNLLKQFFANVIWFWTGDRWWSLVIAVMNLRVP